MNNLLRITNEKLNIHVNSFTLHGYNNGVFMFINGWTKEKVLEQIKKKNVGILAKNDSGKCLYRQKLDGKTNCCLVGAFIPDELYREGMETRAADVVIEVYGLENYMPLSITRMEQLQNFHDNDLEEIMEVTGKSLYELVEEWINNQTKAV